MKQEGTPETPTQKLRKRQKQTGKKTPDPQNPEKRKSIERSGDAKIGYSRLRLALHLRYVGPPVQTRLLSVLVDTKTSYSSRRNSAPEKEEA